MARVDVEKVAVPLVSVPAPRVVEPSLNTTVPVAPEAVTVTVRVTAWPGEDEAGATDRVVVVAAGFTVSVTNADWLEALLVSPL